jgi:hypothetical protein
MLLQTPWLGKGSIHLTISANMAVATTPATNDRDIYIQFELYQISQTQTLIVIIRLS